MKKSVKKAAIAAVLSMAAASQAQDVKQEFSLEGISSVVVNSDAANVVVRATATDAVLVSVVYKDKAEDCIFSAKKQNGRLEVELRGKNQRRRIWGFINAGGIGCRGTVTVSTPWNYPLFVDTASGGVDLLMGTGKGNISTASGDIVVRQAQGELLLHSASGHISAQKLSSLLKAETASGDITLAWSQLPSQGVLSAESASGDISFILPKGSQVKADLDGGVVSQPVLKVKHDPASSLTLRASASSGGIEVKESK